MEAMFDTGIVPYLKELGNGTIFSQTVKIVGIGESRAESMIIDMIDGQTNPTIATYAKTSEVHIRVTASAESEKEAAKLVKPVVRELKKRFGGNVYSTKEEVTFEQSLVELLLSNDMTITCVESCTGGLVSAALVGVSGASDVFKSSFVTYSNKAKRKLAGVSKDTLDRYTAVSAQTAQEMAEGGAKAAGSDVCISVTGLAGPGGGTRKKPVGLVYIGCCVRGRVRVNEYHFSGDRNNVRMLAAKNALILARECILEYIDNK